MDGSFLGGCVTLGRGGGCIMSRGGCGSCLSVEILWPWKVIGNFEREWGNVLLFCGCGLGIWGTEWGVGGTGCAGGVGGMWCVAGGCVLGGWGDVAGC